jgi:hypothetical protein
MEKLLPLALLGGVLASHKGTGALDEVRGQIAEVKTNVSWCWLLALQSDLLPLT